MVNEFYERNTRKCTPVNEACARQSRILGHNFFSHNFFLDTSCLLQYVHVPRRDT